LQKGDILVLEINDYAFEGKGLAKISIDDNPDKKFVVFVNGAYPGDTVEVKIVSYKKSYAEAIVLNIIKASDLRVTPKCKYFSYCGGCKQQDMDYNAQTNYKAAQVKDIFERMAGLKDFIVEGSCNSENIFFYRNKME